MTLTKNIDLWIVAYDGDVDNVYTFSDFDSVKRAIDGYVWSFNTDEDLDTIWNGLIKFLLEMLDTHRDSTIIPISVNSMNIVIYHFKFDETCFINKILSRCYDQVDDDTKREIDKICISSDI